MLLSYTVRSVDEIEALKGSWTDDPCWDIEETPGFEVWHDELLAYRQSVEAEAKWAQAVRIGAKTAALGINATLLLYIEQMENQIRELQAQVRALQNK